MSRGIGEKDLAHQTSELGSVAASGRLSTTALTWRPISSDATVASRLPSGVSVTRTTRPSADVVTPPRQPTALGAVNQPRDAGLIEVHVARKLQHRRAQKLPVAQNAQQPQVNDRQLITGRDPTKHMLD